MATKLWQDSSAATTTLSTARPLDLTVVGSSTQTNTTIAKTTGYIELRSVTPTTGLTAGTPTATTPAPSGNGWLYDTTALEGTTIPAGTWSTSQQMGGSASGSSVQTTLYFRVFKRSSAGVYTSIGMTTVGPQSTTAIANNFQGTFSGSAVSFTTGDKLYVDMVGLVTTNTANSNSTSIWHQTGSLNAYVIFPSAPTISSLSPSSGTTAGGTTVVATGTGFTGATGVTVGGTAATSVSVTNDTTISFVTPSGTAGVVDVVVTTASGSNSNTSADNFTYVTPPTVTGVSPSSFNDGDTVTVTGTGFVAGITKVILPGGAITTTGFTSAQTATVPVGQVSVSSSTSLTFVANFSATTTVVGGTGDLLVDSGAVSAANRPSTLVTWRHDQLNSCEGASGSIITAGTGAWGALIPGVDSSGNPAPTPAYSSTTAANGTQSMSFLYSGANATSWFPCAWSDGGVGAYWRMYGYFTNIGAANVTVMDGCKADSQIGWASGITSAGLIFVTDQNTGIPTAGSVTLSASTWYRLEYFYNTSSTAGAVTMRVYAGNSTTLLDSVSVTLTGAFCPTQMMVLVGRNGSSADHTYYDDLATSTVGWIGPATTSPPAITSLSPTSGGSGGTTSVVITGRNFTSASAVLFGSTAATSYTVNSSTQITAVAPAGTVGTTVRLHVTTPNGSSAPSGGDSYTYIAGPTVTNSYIEFDGYDNQIKQNHNYHRYFYIEGSGFKPSTTNPTVTLNGTACTITSASDTFIEIDNPPIVTSSGLVPMVITASNGIAGTGYHNVEAGFPVVNATGLSLGGVTTTAAPTVSLTTVSGDYVVLVVHQFQTSGATAFQSNLPTSTGDTWRLAARSANGSSTQLQAIAIYVLEAPAAGTRTVTMGVTWTGTPTGPATRYQMFVVKNASQATGGLSYESATAQYYAYNGATGQLQAGPVAMRLNPMEADIGCFFWANGSSTTAPNYPDHTMWYQTGGGGQNSYLGRRDNSPVTSRDSWVGLFTANTNGCGAAVVVMPVGTTAAAPGVPTVSAVSPNLGVVAGGNSVVITGTNFNSTVSSGVLIGGNPVTSYTIDSNTQITAVMPASSSGTYDITVTNITGTSTTSSADQYTFGTPNYQRPVTENVGGSDVVTSKVTQTRTRTETAAAADVLTTQFGRARTATESVAGSDGGALTTFSDDFNRANSATTLGSAYTVVGRDATNIMGISSNQAYVPGPVTGNGAIAVPNVVYAANSPNTDFTFTASTVATTTSLLAAFRVGPANTSGSSQALGYWAVLADRIVYLTPFSGGGTVYGISPAIASGNVVRVTVTGNAVVIYVNGSAVLTQTITSEGSTFVGAGIAADTNSTTRIDNFSINYTSAPAATRAVTLSRTNTETAVAAEVVASPRVMSRAATEAAAAADVSTKAVGRFRNSTETVGAADVLTSVPRAGRTLTETVGGSDSVQSGGAAISPDAIVASSGTTGAVAAIQDSPYAPDGSSITTSGAWSLEVSFPTPASTLKTGAGLQTFRVNIT